MQHHYSSLVSCLICHLIDLTENSSDRVKLNNLIFRTPSKEVTGCNDVKLQYSNHWCSTVKDQFKPASQVKNQEYKVLSSFHVLPKKF